ncbi:MAG: IS701 family transposase [Thermoplasmata archaeon]|nr:IS701 family transposase [Thermoplasmata archaeon]
MKLVLAHRRVEARYFLIKHRNIFTTRRDRSTWPRWKDSWKSASYYHEGLLSPGRKKSMQRISQRMDVNENTIEQFIRESPWDYEELHDHLASQIPCCIRDAKAAFIVDEVSLVKQGRHSVGVQRQYCGAQGKVGNCQVGVDLTYAAPGKHRNADQRTWPLGMRLYLPESWVRDRDRRRECGVPESVLFRTKPDIALDLIDRVRKHNVAHTCTVADAGYGDDGEFRKGLREQKEPYILSVTPSEPLVIDVSIPVIPPEKHNGRGRPRVHLTYPENVQPETPSMIAQRVKNWITVEWSEGTKGKLSGEFYREKVRVVGGRQTRYASDEIVWLLLEKRKDEKGDEELKAYVCWGMDDVLLKTLVEYAHLRWTIEQFHRETKQLLGLDRFEGRSWKGWHHHISMVLLAYAFIAELRAKIQTVEKLPSFPAVVRLVVHEAATQQLMKDHHLTRRKARGIAETMLRRYSDW